ncbi:hypothetical protein K466DRAFT_661867 [Polyporus arcularius HHB13444]|uniref:F-box domain-containing protein n=1 Tax=Polyporus arcularius HHB13444 TaxID=1314778 RepID=A0A5C3PLE2_9APHY|nr:hypothetical protein K466DRAFT_661867 [Polyporus arcularius HHB13444]
MAFYTTRTLTDLPPEILHLILRYMRRDKHYVSSCSRTCRLLRAVALEHLDFRRVSLTGVKTFDPFLQFLRKYPRVAKTVISVCLGGEIEDNDHSPITTIDDTLVVSIAELLPKLDSLVLHSFRYVMPTDLSAARRREPIQLSSFVIEDQFHDKSSLTGIFRVMSLFTPRETDRLELERFDIEESFEPTHLHRPLEFRQLCLQESDTPKHTALTLQALSVSVKSNSLRELHVEVDSKQTVIALGQLLRSAGRRLTTLTIEDVDGHVNSLKGNWKKLNLSACKKLRYITLPMVYRQNPKRPLSETLVKILGKAPPSLRKITIRVYGMLRATTIGNRKVFKIHDFDKLLSPERFPHLQVFELEIGPHGRLRYRNGYWATCFASAQRALKGLHERGLLRVKKLQRGTS